MRQLVPMSQSVWSHVLIIAIGLVVVAGCTTPVSPSASTDADADLTTPGRTEASSSTVESNISALQPTIAPDGTSTPALEALPSPAATNEIAGGELPVAIVRSNANVRGGPSTDFEKVGVVMAGESLPVYAIENGWAKLDEAGTRWIGTTLLELGDITSLQDSAANKAATELVADDTPVEGASESAATLPAPEAKEPADDGSAGGATGGSNENAFQCVGGCAEAPDASCSIKGNVNPANDTRIYHTVGSTWYDRTDIVFDEGDRWFCTIQEAIDAGFRAPNK